MGSCHVRVILREVIYGGDDIGNDWEYRMKVWSKNKDLKGDFIQIPEHILNWGSTEKFRGEVRGINVLLNKIVEGCEGNKEFEIRFWAKEHDWIWDDIPNSRATIPINFPCSVGPSPMTKTIKIPEKAFFADNEAELTFVFEVSLRCITDT